MKVVITGGAGFLGRRLAQAILARGTLTGPLGDQTAISELVCVDIAEPETPLDGVTWIEGDICDPALVAKAVAPDTASIFHLAAVVSAEAEADFDLGMRVNLDATRTLLERARGLERPPRFIFASSIAAFGVAPPVVHDETPVRPLNSYGVEKAIGEYLVGEYARRGWVDGRSFRLPTIAIRPGKPNKAASSFASSILREPLWGERTVCPVGRELSICILSPNALVANLIHGHELEPSVWQDGLRVINLPGLTVTVGEMVAALERAGGDSSLIDWRRDATIDRIVGSWPRAMKSARADALGFTSDTSIDAIIRAFLDDRRELEDPAAAHGEQGGQA